MNLQPCRKLDHGRCVPAEETVARLERLLGARFEYRLLEEKVAEHLYWAALFLDNDPAFRAMGKGVSAVRSRAGALAEAAEWLGALDPDRLPGYLAAHQDDVTEPVPIEDLVAHVATVTPPVLARIKDLDNARHWADAVSLLDGRTRKVPVEYLRQISGPNGRAAGVIGEKLDLPASSLSFHLAHLTRAGLISQRREGRSLFYAADFDAMNGLVGFLKIGRAHV